MLTVEEIMTKNPITCDFETPIQDVARLMRDNRVGSVVVLRDGKVAGMVTDRMITCDGLGAGKDGETPVNECMTEDTARLHKEDNVFAAVDTLRSAGVVRRAPVVNSYDELEGVVSIGDIATVTKRLVDAIMLDETHDATDRTRVRTGAKRLGPILRTPTKLHKLPPDEETHVTKEPTEVGTPPKTGRVPNRERMTPERSSAKQ